MVTTMTTAAILCVVVDDSVVGPGPEWLVVLVGLSFLLLVVIGGTGTIVGTRRTCFNFVIHKRNLDDVIIIIILLLLLFGSS